MARIKISVALSVLSIYLVSCTDCLIENEKIILENSVLSSLYLDKGTTPINSDQAEQVALVYEYSHFNRTKSSIRRVKDVQTILNTDGKPTMYVVDFESDNGFIIISASRYYYPVLADIPNGRFQERQSSGFNIWLKEQIALIDKAESISDSEQYNNCYIDEWKPFEKKNTIDCIATKDDDILTLRANAISAWEAQGYECFDLCDCPNSLPQSVYQNWLYVAEQNANPNYDYYTNSIILYQREDGFSQTGPLLATTWGQDYPYNQGLNMIGSLYPRSGCSIVAMGQIMKYHEYPTSYNWSGMSNQPYTIASAPTTLFYDLGRDALTNYGVDSSSTIIDNLYNAITNIYNYNGTIINHAYSTAKTEIMSSRPVFMQGKDPSNNSAHAWVCDGSKTSTVYRKYILKVLSNDEPLSFISAGTPYESYDYFNYLHMNWGEDGDANGWFFEDSVHYFGTLYNTWIEFNFSTQRQDIIGLTPNS